MSAVDPRLGRTFSGYCTIRGRISIKEVDQLMMSCIDKDSKQFVKWIPSSTKWSICDIPPKCIGKSTTFISNSTAIQDVFKRFSQQFNTLFKRKAFLHWYTGEGMEQEEFTEAQQVMYDLINEYQQFHTSFSISDQTENKIDKINETT
ncbi:MAG: putative tubulin beta-2C chain [Streblomastix strix]|uniref:Putative tubulin beta-2C chain n=1 Tax=Streblomastix strix TaxID=222440 RepID=A0A5J4X4F2_9EUKA|nr:MAG: putative tubulin beta-2C chain [Streblomastix strix]